MGPAPPPPLLAASRRNHPEKLDSLQGAPSRSTRHRILQAIESHGPTTVAEVARRLSISPKTVYYHCGRLLRAHRIDEHGVGRRRFLVVRGAPVHWRRDALLAEPGLRALFEAIRKSPGIEQRELVATQITRGAKRSTVQHRLKRLEYAGFVERRREGARRHCLFVRR